MQLMADNSTQMKLTVGNTTINWLDEVRVEAAKKSNKHLTRADVVRMCINFSMNAGRAPKLTAQEPNQDEEGG